MSAAPSACSPDSAVRLLEAVAFEIGRARRGRDPEAIHDLRVAIRRFLQALAILKPLFPGKELKRMRRRMRRILRLAGAVRDCDIVTAYLSSMKVPEAKLLKRRIETRRRDAANLLVVGLNKWVAERTSAKWRVWLHSAPPATLPDAPQDSIGRLGKLASSVLDRGVRAVNSAGSPDDLHRLRIVVREFRYRLELVSAAFGPRAVEWLDRLAQLQAALGPINDCRTAREMVAQAGNYHRIEAALKRKQQRRVSDFRKLWAAQFDAAGAQEFRRAFSPVSGKPAGHENGAGGVAAAAAGA